MSHHIEDNENFNYFEACDLTLPDEVSEFVQEWKNKPGNLIAVLHKVQDYYGYIPRTIAMKVSQILEQPLAKIYGVISFYHYFRLKKPGKHNIQVCTGTACYLADAFDLIQGLEDVLGVGINCTTPDGLFSVEMVRCVGCCGLAPVMVIGKEVFGHVKEDQLAEIVKRYRDLEENQNG